MRTNNKQKPKNRKYRIRTNIFFQSNGSEHAGQVVVPIRRDILEVGAGRVLQVV